MKLGIHYMNFGLAAPEALAESVASTARIADEAGMALFTVMDHYFQMEPLGGPAEPMLEAYSTLGFVAGQTTSIELGVLVTGITYRPPGLLAKVVSTLDVLSKGRALLGLGAAWYEREHVGLGVPYPPLAERFEMLEETIQVVLQMWSDETGPYEGKHYSLAETVNVPQPVQRPRPPIMIGGGGEKKTLRLVAEHADACNLFAHGVDVVGHKLDVLARHCDEVGRDLSTIRKTILGGPDPLQDLDGFLAEMERYAALGVELVLLSPHAGDPATFASRLGEEVLPRLAALTP